MALRSFAIQPTVPLIKRTKRAIVVNMSRWQSKKNQSHRKIVPCNWISRPLDLCTSTQEEPVWQLVSDSTSREDSLLGTQFNNVVHGLPVRIVLRVYKETTYSRAGVVTAQFMVKTRVLELQILVMTSC